MTDVDRLLLEWHGEEEALLANIVDKYEPVSVTNVDEIRAQIVEIYRRRNARKLADVDGLLEEWKGEEEELLKQIEAKYPDKRSKEEKRVSRIRRMKTVRHLNLGGEFGKPPAIEEAPRPRSEQQTAALVAALRAAAGSRSAEQVTIAIKV